ncbi:N-acetylmuramoyl-L-alanine amidase [Pseudomonas sp. ArH3a]|uniref:N-acetylmuramoyl-L-alanine amidase n=1 Tax=Pseudomonas TaxID=286 RepID=UPI000BA0A4CD|nr:MULTISPECIES: N-acetylmuramoyl-L-alanine amidase [unclassified Pseudomonas]MCV2230380.1 N-acetylmuramoyl-L-alanine amidase [Pseudomonas sp. AU10]OZO02230.1 N-acetylmuramoyl-L-alanine amidase [Pseudomonas sp. IB20]UNM22155.1 N-acetylmuramoyl-L-alanine amidase [Pseudomonas sp. ArH3a]
MKTLILFLAILTMAGCTTGPKNLIAKNGYAIDTTHESQSQNERVRHLVLHYTVLDDHHSLQALTSGTASAHYLAFTTPPTHHELPVALQLVPEGRRAWHAGVSQWASRNNLNDTSIGIEIVNAGFIEGPTGRLWFPYTEAQLTLVKRLSADLIKRYGIEPQNVVAHSDIAPLRKSDPGPLFPWQAFSEHGIGAWPDAATVQKHLAKRPESQRVEAGTLQKALAAYGYKIAQTGVLDEETRQVFRAFQMHFRPAGISGIPDAQTEAIALALVEKYRP